MVTDRLIDKLGSEPILSVDVNLKGTVTETVRVNGSYILFNCHSLLQFQPLPRAITAIGKYGSYLRKITGKDPTLGSQAEGVRW